MIVVNSSPLISLGKQARLGLLKNCFGKILISKSVYDEVLRKKDSPEAIALKKAAQEKWVTVEKATVNTLLVTGKIGQGEKEAMSLAVKRKTLLLIDDDVAKTYASLLGVEAHGTLYVLFLAFSRNFITKADVKSILDGMIADGFYLSTELYAKFSDLLDSLKKAT